MNQSLIEILSQKIDLSAAQIQTQIDEILSKSLDKNRTPEVYKRMFNCIDLTSLNTSDSAFNIVPLCEKVNRLEETYPEMPSVAAVCVYPNLVELVRMNLEVSDVRIASVAGGFPTSQTFLEIKTIETALVVRDGADEVDIVLNVGQFLNQEYQEVSEEIQEVKTSCGDACLKVILESGLLDDPQSIYLASMLSMYSGADFIKTSTGKCEPAATLSAVYVMALAIKKYYDKTQKKIGIKSAGGIVTTEQALQYYTVIESVLGHEWMNNELFRIGASRLANNLLSDTYGETIAYF